MGIDTGVDLHITTNSPLGFIISYGYNMYMKEQATFEIESSTKVGNTIYYTDPYASHKSELINKFFRASIGITYEINM